jgi:hypothetical protein
MFRDDLELSLNSRQSPNASGVDIHPVVIRDTMYLRRKCPAKSRGLKLSFCAFPGKG